MPISRIPSSYAPHFGSLSTGPLFSALFQRTWPSKIAVVVLLCVHRLSPLIAKYIIDTAQSKYMVRNLVQLNVGISLIEVNELYEPNLRELLSMSILKHKSNSGSDLFARNVVMSNAPWNSTPIPQIHTKITVKKKKNWREWKNWNQTYWRNWMEVVATKCQMDTKGPTASSQLIENHKATRFYCRLLI